jgi:hypothetical protein
MANTHGKDKHDVLLTLPRPLAEAATRHARRDGLTRAAWIRTLISIATRVPDDTNQYTPRRRSSYRPGGTLPPR